MSKRVFVRSFATVVFVVFTTLSAPAATRDKSADDPKGPIGIIRERIIRIVKKLPRPIWSGVLDDPVPPKP